MLSDIKWSSRYGLVEHFDATCDGNGNAYDGAHFNRFVALCAVELITRL